MVINQVTISDERKKKYDFSTPYTISGIQALVKKGNEGTIKTADDLKGKKVGVGLGTNYEEWLQSECSASMCVPMMMTRPNIRICA